MIVLKKAAFLLYTIQLSRRWNLYILSQTNKQWSVMWEFAAKNVCQFTVKFTLIKWVIWFQNAFTCRLLRVLVTCVGNKGTKQFQIPSSPLWRFCSRVQTTSGMFGNGLSLCTIRLTKERIKGCPNKILF